MPEHVRDKALVGRQTADLARGLDVPDKELALRVARDEILGVGAKVEAAGVAGNEMADVALLAVELVARVGRDAIEKNLVVHGLKGGPAKGLMDGRGGKRVHVRFL